MNIVELNNVSKSYMMGQVRVDALKSVDLSITKGDFVAVAGPSGAGKTTIMNMIGLVDQPCTGSVLIDGIETSRLADNALTDLRREKLGFIFQSFNLLPILDVQENVELPLLVGNNLPDVKQRNEWVNHLIEEVGLTEWKRHKPAELSGGQRQRVAIARALVAKPDIVIADEPTANLDTETGQTILNLMKKMNEEHNTTFIFSTHDPAIRQLADHVVQLKDGEVL